MRTALAIARRDLCSTCLSPFGVGAAAGFAALAGVLLVLDLRGDEARLDNWFAPLYVLLGLVAALLTMRSFADEERTGSLELVLTAPLRRSEVVAGKLLGAAGVLLVLEAVTVVCPALVGSMGDPDWGPVGTGYLGLVLVGVAFVAVGLAVSAATSNPLAAAAGATAVLAALWFGGILAGGIGGRAGTGLTYLTPASHVTGFLRGTIAAGDVTYFVSLAVLGYGATVAVLGVRR